MTFSVDSSTGIRSFYFKDDNKTVINDGSNSMEFAMFHLDISSSRPSSPDDIGCLTYNINKPDPEFQKRMDQLKKEAFNNWLEGKMYVSVFNISNELKCKHFNASQIFDLEI